MIPINPQAINLLLVEDSVNDARQIALMLGHARKVKFTVTRAASVAEAIDELTEQAFDAIVMDLALPDAQGVSGLLAIREAAKRIPIIIACGLHNEELALKALPLGASDYVIKNYLDADLLQRTIRSAIERKHTRNALEEQTRILGSILNSIADGVIVANQEGEWLLINPAAKKIFGFEAGHDPSDGWPDQHDLFLADGLTPYPPEELPLTRARCGQVVKEQELFIRPPNVPEGVVVSVNATPLIDEHNNVIGGVAVFRDVTVRRLAEEQIRQLRAVLE